VNWLRNCWQVAAYAGDIGSSLLARTFLGEDVVLFRDTAGTAHALADRCAHRCLPLSKGRLIGDIVQCGYHGMRFHPDGSCDGVPGQDSIPPRAIVPAYPVAERHGFIWIWMGDAAAADPALVPEAFWFANPAWATATGYHYIEADYRLLIDNLLDLSHESFVHTDTIGNGAVADSPVTAQIVDGRVKVHRFMANTPPPPFYTTTTGVSTNIDRWHTTYYDVPGTVIIENGSMPAGTDIALAKQRRILNFITPETATSSHYFWGVARQWELDNAELTETIRTDVIHTFDQDKVLLEAQQRVLSSDPSLNAFPVTIKIDAGPILGRRLLETKLAEEHAARTSVLEPA
jgi:phenylpropionate dioxygenase-like ring-hydroxylating dioxygenase large terminal subunit